MNRDAGGSRFYYSRLSEGEKNLYTRLCEALFRFEPALSVHAGMGKAFAVDMKAILSAVLLDNPVFFYLNRERVIIKQTPLYIQVVFQYDYTPAEAEALWAQVEERVAGFLKNRIRPGMSQLAKQLQVHHYVYTFHTAQPPYNRDDFSVIGAFVRGGCVCEGYAKAYKLLCDRVRLASIVVTGEALLPDGRREPHSWNITRVDGVTAHTDAAWDSRIGGAAYDYFNLCDADIAADHAFDAERYPACEPNRINYFYKNGLIARDEAELHRLIGELVDEPYYAVKLLFPFSADRLAELPFDIGDMRYNAAQNVVGFVKAMVE